MVMDLSSGDFEVAFWIYRYPIGMHSQSSLADTCSRPGVRRSPTTRSASSPPAGCRRAGPLTLGQVIRRKLPRPGRLRDPHPGASANVLVVDGDPLEGLDVLRSVAMVMLKGVVTSNSAHASPSI